MTWTVLLRRPSVGVPVIVAAVVVLLGLSTLVGESEDANIGLGIFVLVGLPVVGVLLVWSLLRALWIRSRERRR